MMTVLLLLSLSQVRGDTLGSAGTSLSREEPVQLYDEGTRLNRVTRLNFTGSGVSCSASNGTGTCAVSGGGGGGSGGTADGGVASNASAPFVTFQADGTLTNARVLTSGTNTTVDLATPGQAKVNLSGTLSASLGGLGVAQPTCSSTEVLTCNGSVCSCVFSPQAFEVSVDLTSASYPVLSTTVTGLGWVTATSKIACAPFATSADSQTVETYLVSGLQVVAANRVAGVGVDLLVSNPIGASGVFRFHCFGG